MSDASSTHTTLKAIVPSDIQKHVARNDGSAPIISTLWSKENMTTNLDLGTSPEGWTKVEHPDSTVYHVHEGKGVFTAANVLDSNICNLIMDTAERLRSAMQALLDDHKADLVLDVQGDKKTAKISYYCVFHAKRRVFWLQGMRHEEVDVPCPSKMCTKLKVHCIEAQYWKHCELFPMTFKVSREVTGNLKGILLQTAADTLLDKSSTSSRGKEDLEYMLNLVKEIEKMAHDQRGSDYSAWIVAKLMALHNDDVLRNSHSQSNDSYQPSRLLTILRPLLRGVPDMYTARLQSFRGNSIQECWLDFVHGIDKNMRDTYLLATVLLSTNAGLLAWTGTSNPNGINAPSPEQILAYISIICSYGSVSMGFVFFKPFRMVATNVPPRALLSKDVPYGLERIAVLLSLPDVLLAWGMDAFLAAFCVIFYKQTGIQVRVPATVALCFVFLCKAYPAYAFTPSRVRQQSSVSEA